MRIYRFSLLAALALSAAAFHPAEARCTDASHAGDAQCAATEFLPAAVPSHRMLMRRSLSAFAKVVAKPFSRAKVHPGPVAAPFGKNADKAALLASELKYMKLSTAEVQKAVLRQESKLLQAETSFIQANKHLKDLQLRNAPRAEILQAEAAKNAASAAVRAGEKELTALTTRLNSGLREITAKAKTRVVQFKSGAPQIDKAVTKEQAEKLAAQLDLKQLKGNLANAELTLKLNTPAAQKALREFTEQSTKADDAMRALEQANTKFLDLGPSASPAAVLDARRALDAARQLQVDEAGKLSALTKNLPNEVDRSVLTTIAKNERILLSSDPAKLGSLIPGPLDIAGSKVISKEVAEANVAQLKKAVEQAEKRLADATNAVLKKKQDPNVLETGLRSA
ncbi:MAG: hypothetical protein BJ554DRAFT_3082 [Olpidium bornovanus]|uniref:Uncharacterized protein n=1 Tax=Olpidium bornovanus TaxID=278681 RepID=A0A8H7ZPL5_9FUNG|nr:MAG: hypothetical protein BJ554DRAFT_3082 [Olpidium bornovanus]